MSLRSPSVLHRRAQDPKQASLSKSSAAQRLEQCSTADATSIIKSIDRAQLQLSLLIFYPDSGTTYCVRPVGDGVFCFRNVGI
jgi:hypothetical protein